MNLDAIKARCAAATPGPWESGNGAIWHSCDTEAMAEVAEFVNPNNADFIAHARTDVPALVAEVERLRAALDAILNIVSPENDPDDHSLTVEGIVDNVRAMRDLLHATMKERDAERKACDEWRKYAAMPDEDADLFQYGEDLDALCVKHDARRAAEKGTTNGR